MRASSLFLSLLCCHHVSFTSAWISAPFLKNHHALHPNLVTHHNKRRRRHHFVSNHHHSCCCSLSLDDTNEIMSSGTPIALVAAMLLFVAAQGFINQLVSGNQGLGAYLKDGSGYNKSAFSPNSQEMNNQDDPLPWLSLPKLDFVDVKGQDDDGALLELELQEIRLEMKEKLREGKIQEATALRDKLERVMETSGFEFETDESSL